MDNTAIERIAAADLANEASDLLKKYGANDQVVFFLGRFAWKGDMITCVPDLLPIACDASRGRYARIASARAVMTLGNDEQKDTLWQAITSHPGPLDRRLLAELVEQAAPTMASVDMLLLALERLEPYERFEGTGLEQALHEFVDRLPLMADAISDQPVGRLLDGLNELLNREPHLERGECFVSKDYAWLMGSALHIVDLMVGARSAIAMSPSAISVMLKLPTVRFWSSDNVPEYRSSLGENVPRWRDLNDHLYWQGIEERRRHQTEKGERVCDEWHIAWMDHFWGFTAGDFDRCVGWVTDKPLLDDRMVAITRCLDLYFRSEQPVAWKERLVAAVADSADLRTFLDARLNPQPSPAMERMHADNKKFERQAKERKRRSDRNRAEWVEVLKADPDRVRHPAISPGEFSGDQYQLLMTLLHDGKGSDHDAGAQWQVLIAEFGQAVAEAYRDAAVNHWRHYKVEVGSEGAKLGSTPYSLIFGMVGLAIEAGDDANFPDGLSPDDAKQAVRYVTWELNGFPRWFEALYGMHPAVVRDAVTRELLWELEHTGIEQPMHYILHDIVYHTPWLHGAMAPVVYGWLATHDLPNAEALRYSLTIILGGDTPAADIAALATSKIASSLPTDQCPRWYALWVDSDPVAAIPALSEKLATLSQADATNFAVQFLVGLVGGRHSEGVGKRVNAFKTVAHLKTLYLLMHQHIRVAEDIDRADGGVYSPTARDYAQDARNSLFEMLTAVPGADAYAAMKALEAEHPESNYRNWMGRSAHRRALADADEPAWSDSQVSAFVQQLRARGIE